MKGLFIKDIRLLLCRKSAIFLIFAISLFLIFTNQNVIFSVTYIMFIIAIWSMNTLTNDTADNGMSFLFTLPVTKKDYIIEKYTLTIVNVIIANIFVTISGIIIVKNMGNDLCISDTIKLSLLLLFFVLFFTSIIFPINLKFGNDHGIIVFMLIVGLISAVLFSINKSMKIDLLQYVNSITEISSTILLTCSTIVCIIFTVISVYISINIIQDKEY